MCDHVVVLVVQATPVGKMFSVEGPTHLHHVSGLA
jgi:hypothetical protein